MMKSLEMKWMSKHQDLSLFDLKLNKSFQWYDDIEDENHFICICQLPRRRYIPEYYYTRPNMHTFIELMSNDDTKTVCNLANFVFRAF